MAIRSLRVLASFIHGDTRRAEAEQTSTLCIALEPRAGVTPSDKPPVRIYLGTEAAQFRAERAFVWSIERVRDPARRYEIHLMKDFVGFERRLWLTGFTNYRFAIPELAGGEGRAIYNDADQIYRHDPALLFDLPMHDKGVLSINDRDTSVMLIDCERMVGLWNGTSARNTGNRELEKQMREADLWGDLDNGWNARDAEYAPGQSHLIHYTTIHTQPWRPTPADYVYRANPASEIWMSIEREADAAGFQLFLATCPSPEFALRGGDRRMRAPRADRMADFRRLVADSHAATLSYYGYDRPDNLAALAGAGQLTGTHIACATPEALTSDGHAQADIVAADGLAQLPDLDMPWVLDALFNRAARALIVAVELDDGGHRSTPADPLWWYAQMAAAGVRHANRHWRLVVRRRRWARAPRISRWSGGALLHETPRVWALMHYKTGHHSQTMGVADALGWAYDSRDIVRAPARYAAGLLAGRFGLPGQRLPGGIHPPWPEVVVASGWLPALVARWISERNAANTRLILLGRRGGRVGETQDIGIVCRHFNLPPNPRQLETVLPPSKVAERQLLDARQRWPDPYGAGTGPRVALLVGGDSAQHALDVGTARTLAERVGARAREASARLAVLTSRRSGRDSEAEIGTALRAALGDNVIVEPWRAERAPTDNPYLGYLAQADILVVTGESESMIAEAVATGKPVYIYPLPERRPGRRRQIADWVVRQAETDRFNARGSRRPQQGLQYLCARLVDRRVFVPRRDMDALHAALVAQGVARLFGESLTAWRPPAWHETDWLARRIRAWLPVAGHTPQRAGPSRAGGEGERAAHG